MICKEDGPGKVIEGSEGHMASVSFDAGTNQRMGHGRRAKRKKPAIEASVANRSDSINSFVLMELDSLSLGPDSVNDHLCFPSMIQLFYLKVFLKTELQVVFQGSLKSRK